MDYDACLYQHRKPVVDRDIPHPLIGDGKSKYYRFAEHIPVCPGTEHLVRRPPANWGVHKFYRVENELPPFMAQREVNDMEENEHMKEYGKKYNAAPPNEQKKMENAKKKKDAAKLKKAQAAQRRKKND